MHPLWCYLFVVTLKLDLYGLGIALTITYFTALSIVTIYSFSIARIRRALILPDCDTLKYWGNYLRIGIPSMIMLWSEDFGLYVLTILTGLVSVQA